MTRLTFGEGIRDGLPIGFGYLSVAVAFGMSMVQNGFPLWTPVVISLTNFSGTGQMVGGDLMARGAGLSAIAFTILTINLRYLLMSLSLSQKLPEGFSLPERLLIAFGVTDEIYAVSMQQKKPLTLPYLVGLIFISYAGWNLGTVIGGAANAILPETVRSALGIAIYAMFVAIVLPPARDDRPTLLVVIGALALSCLFRLTPVLRELSSVWAVLICGLAASAVAAVLFPMEKVGQTDE